MAVRTITTKLALDGEQEFKRAMDEVNASLNEMGESAGLSVRALELSQLSAEELEKITAELCKVYGVKKPVKIVRSPRPRLMNSWPPCRRRQPATRPRLPPRTRP